MQVYKDQKGATPELWPSEEGSSLGWEPSTVPTTTVRQGVTPHRLSQVKTTQAASLRVNL